MPDTIILFLGDVLSGPKQEASVCFTVTINDFILKVNFG